MMKRMAVLLLIAALAVVGIVMSSHSAMPAGHASVASSAPVLAQDPGHEHSSASSATAMPDAPLDPTAEPCAPCGGDHTGMLLACAMLALLLITGVLLPLVAVRHGIRAPGVVARGAAPRRVAPPQPPDLAQLCISRQ